MKTSEAIGTLLVAVGLGVTTYVWAVKTSEFHFGYWIASVAPYVLGALMLWFRQPQAATGALFFPTCFEEAAFYSEFVSPKSFTAALVYAILPFWNLGLFVPLGGALGWWVGKRTHETAL